MQFITDNYIWFIVGGVVILMAVIGYIADKTDFGRKKAEKKEKQPKVKKEKQDKPEKIEVDAKGIGDLTQSMAMVQDDAEGYTNVELPQEDLYAPLEPLVNAEATPVVEESLYAPLTDTVSAEVPMEMPVVEPMEQEVQPTMEAPMLEPLQPITLEEPVVVSETVEENVAEEPMLENIQPIETPVEFKEEMQETTDDDDVWKF